MSKQNNTIDFYEQNAAEFCEKHDAVRLDPIHQAIRAHLSHGSKLLEIGCGSGRDAARALADGYDVIALDGAKNLIAEIPKRHPELAGRLVHTLLPAKLNFGNNYFDGFYSVACLMHMPTNDILQVLKELLRVTKPNGKGFVSVPLCRPDIDASGFDDKGRLMNIMPIEGWQALFTEAGFTSEKGEPEYDKLGREGIFWLTFTLTKDI